MDKFIKRKHSSDDNESESKHLSKVAKTCNKTPKARPKRQFCDGYLKYEFTGQAVRINLSHCVSFVAKKCQTKVWCPES